MQARKTHMICRFVNRRRSIFSSNALANSCIPCSFFQCWFRRIGIYQRQFIKIQGIIDTLIWEINSVQHLCNPQQHIKYRLRRSLSLFRLDTARTHTIFNSTCLRRKSVFRVFLLNISHFDNVDTCSFFSSMLFSPFVLHSLVFLSIFGAAHVCASLR